MVVTSHITALLFALSVFINTIWDRSNSPYLLSQTVTTDLIKKKADNRTHAIRIGSVPVVRIAIVVAITEVGANIDTTQPKVPTTKFRITPYD